MVEQERQQLPKFYQGYKSWGVTAPLFSEILDKPDTPLSDRKIGVEQQGG
jgi:hypothetical protein